MRLILTSNHVTTWQWFACFSQMFLKTFLQTPYLYILKLGNFKLDLIISDKCGFNYNVNGRILNQADNVYKTADLKCCPISILCSCACTQAQHKIKIDLSFILWFKVHSSKKTISVAAPLSGLVKLQQVNVEFRPLIHKISAPCYRNKTFLWVLILPSSCSIYLTVSLSVCCYLSDRRWERQFLL